MVESGSWVRVFVCLCVCVCAFALQDWKLGLELNLTRSIMKPVSHAHACSLTLPLSVLPSDIMSPQAGTALIGCGPMKLKQEPPPGELNCLWQLGTQASVVLASDTAAPTTSSQTIQSILAQRGVDPGDQPQSLHYGFKGTINTRTINNDREFLADLNFKSASI